MNDFDTQSEWRALEETYTAMSDEELCALAEKAYDLTDLAKQALTEQLSARKLEVALVEQPVGAAQRINQQQEPEGDLDPKELDLVSVARVWDAAEADAVIYQLYDAGIPAYMGPDNVENVSDFRGSFDTGVDIRVRSIDERPAWRALRLESPQQKAEEAEEEKPCEVFCPVCKSDEVVFEELVAAASASGSAPSQKFRWKCDHCGHEWEDDGIEECHGQT
ncbi:MAG: hypothetical protein WAM71_02770 [Candidatus Korobacteraceae bacterium]